MRVFGSGTGKEALMCIPSRVSEARLVVWFVTSSANLMTLEMQELI